MFRLLRGFPLFLLVVPAGGAPSPAPSRLAWGNLNILLMSDSVRGTLVWAASRPTGNRDSTRSRDFVGFMKPGETVAWARSAREFASQRLTSADTGTFRASEVLAVNEGDRLYMVRLNQKGNWTSERFIVFQGKSDAGLMLIEGTERNAREFLDSLESVSRRTVLTPGATGDGIPIANPVDSLTCPIPDPRNQPPEYPKGEWLAGIEGEVWMSFVVRHDSTVDEATMQVLLSDSPEFTTSVRTALARSRFQPANAEGQPFATRTFQKFLFTIRRDGHAFHPTR